MMSAARTDYITDTVINEVNLLLEEGYSSKQVILALFAAAAEVAVASDMRAGEFQDWFDRTVDVSAREFRA
jgi:hypothetical protein